MLDLRTLVVGARVHNLNPTTLDANGTTILPAKPLKFLSPSLSGLLASARVTIGGVQVSECQYIARTEHVLGVMMTDQEKRRDYTEGFGLQVAAANADYGGYQSEPIPGGESRDVV